MARPRDAGPATTHICRMYGHALSANVISMLLPNLLLIANLITYEEFGNINDA